MKFFIRHPERCTEFSFDREVVLTTAERALAESTFHITDTQAPFSEGGPHDYYSNGDYWWPNPSTIDGFPYIRRDGETNPENFWYHRKMLRKLRTYVVNLTVGYRITGKTEYAQKAITLLKEFFLDEATRMNPHLQFAQAIPGVCAGRGIGIIDTLHLIDIPVVIDILHEASLMNDPIYHGLQDWFKDYLYWISHHPYGIEEQSTLNNHAVCWYVQAAVFASFIGDAEMLDFCRNQYKSVLLPNQMAPDGSFPLELARTKPYSYSILVLDNMVTLCHVLATPEEDLWEYTLDDGRGIRRGLEYLYPYLREKSKWPYPPDVQHFEGWPTAISMLLFAGIALNDEKYLQLWRELEHNPKDLEIRRSMAIRQPLLWCGMA